MSTQSCVSVFAKPPRSTATLRPCCASAAARAARGPRSRLYIPARDFPGYDLANPSSIAFLFLLFWRPHLPCSNVFAAVVYSNSYSESFPAHPGLETARPLAHSGRSAAAPRPPRIPRGRPPPHSGSPTSGAPEQLRKTPEQALCRPAHTRRTRRHGSDGPRSRRSAVRRPHTGPQSPVSSVRPGPGSAAGSRAGTHYPVQRSTG